MTAGRLDSEARARIDSCNRAAALPVGASSTTVGLAMRSTASITRAATVVLPVPGPPVITDRRREQANRTACSCAGCSEPAT